MLKHLFRACLSLLTVATLAARAEVYISTTPSNATVYCDGVQRGPAPLVLDDLTPGPHLIIARHPNYQDARRSLEVIPDRRQVVDLILRPLTGLALIRSTPPGAETQINGLSRGRTPLLVSDLPLGKHRVQLTLTGYVPQELELNLVDRTPQQLEATLLSTLATLVVESNPKGASVILNGISKGETPARISGIPAGKVNLELKLDGHAPFTSTLTLLAGREEKVTTDLKALPSGLQVVSLPERARIYVDNQFRGEAPVELKKIDAGEHRLRAELKGFTPAARTVTLKPGENRVEEFRLERNAGTLQLITTPAAVEVSIDGVAMGSTSVKSGDNDTQSDPLLLDTLAPGTHRIELSRKGYFAHTATVEISKDETTPLKINLRRRFTPNYEVVTVNGTRTGVLVLKEANGDVKLEVQPGITTIFAAGDIVSQRTLPEPK